MKLLIDIGNTRLKWACAGPGGLGEATALPHDGDPALVLQSLPMLHPTEVWITQVTGAAQESALADAVQRRYALQPQFARSGAEWRGLRSAYREPQRLGVDRWLAMMAAWATHRGAACVIDAGTALTADVIAADGRHLGGFIAAGLDTQQRAVLGATRFATRDVDAIGYQSGLGTDTETCVRQGALLACVGAIERAAAQAGAGAALLITGGDAARLLPHLDLRWRHEPLLVLEGLRQLADS